MVRIIGIDPGLGRTGYGVIDSDGNALRFVDCGALETRSGQPIAERLIHLGSGLTRIIDAHRPGEAAVEKIFVHLNPSSALKLGHARAAALITLAQHNLDIAEYAPNLVKKAVVGRGHADKTQVGHMVNMLLPAARVASADAADALAIAICHAHSRSALGRAASDGKVARR